MACGAGPSSGLGDVRVVAARSDVCRVGSVWLEVVVAASSTASTAGALGARMGSGCTLAARSVQSGCQCPRRAGTCERRVLAGCLCGRRWLLAPALCVVFLLVGAAPSFADRAMSTRFSVNDNGNIAFAANGLMVCPAAAPGCTAARNTPPISSGTNNALNNNNYSMQYVNTAPPGTVGGVAKFDSSSATLSLPSTATVLFAGLYWGADTSAGAGGGVAAPNAGIRNQVGFLTPGAPVIRRSRRRRSTTRRRRRRRATARSLM